MNAQLATVYADQQPQREPGVQAITSPRPVVFRTRGTTRGPITRLMSPGDLGQLVKPFVFLDLFTVKPSIGGAPMGMHPHSGIATLTYLMEGEVGYEDSTGKQGTLPTGGVEWMRAGNGVWHDGVPVGQSSAKGFQLWVALPAAEENAPAQSLYLSPDDVPVAGPVRGAAGPLRHAGKQDPGTGRPDLPERAAAGWRALALCAAGRPHRGLDRGARRPAGSGRDHRQRPDSGVQGCRAGHRGGVGGCELLRAGLGGQASA
ncbi:pirin family protein [Xanthomonas hortorum pv. pelargonii]|nr:pirin family protein [Xanthomonas hortorum pv. pelargonii]